MKSRKGKIRVSIGLLYSLLVIFFENNVEESKVGKVLFFGLMCSIEIFFWGKGGVRSSSRNSNVNGGMSRNVRRIYLVKLVDFFYNLEDNDEEV